MPVVIAVCRAREPGAIHWAPWSTGSTEQAMRMTASLVLDEVRLAAPEALVHELDLAPALLEARQ
jgi:hypothetical protein